MSATAGAGGIAVHADGFKRSANNYQSPRHGAQQLRREHGPGCGHEAVPHGDHVDYLVDGHLHHPHGDHCDDHGPLEKA